MDNNIWYINSYEGNLLKNKYENNKKIYLVEIDGAKTRNEKLFLREVSEKFRFPVFSAKHNCYVSWFEGAYTGLKSKLPTWEICEDWLTDLNWLDYDSYVLIISNFNSFLSKDKDFKKFLIAQLETKILPWWEEEVKNCMIDGKAKNFNIYFVE